MSAPALPPQVAWRHQGAREGFEVVFIERRPAGWELFGTTTAVQDGEAWRARYRIEVDQGWRTRCAHLELRTVGEVRDVELVRGARGFTVDGQPVTGVEDCVDVDLEVSVLTNAFPLFRTAPAEGERVEVPAAFISVGDLGVTRIEQSYARLPDRGGLARYDYESPTFAFRAELAYDRTGLVVDYPGLAVRADASTSASSGPLGSLRTS